MTGQKVPFDDVAELKVTSGISEIQRKDSKRTTSVIALLHQGTPMAGAVEIINEKIANGEIIIPEGVDLNFGGAYEAMDDSFSDLGQKLVIAIILIFAVLVIQFDSYKQPFVILLAVPMGIIGVAFGHFFTGVHFGIMSFMALVALSGIVVNDSIVLIDTINQNRTKHNMSYLNSITEGVKTRFIPVIATSITTIAGVLPLAMYNEDYSQMAWTLIFGLSASTLLILVLVPVTLAQLENKKIRGEQNA